MNSPTGAGRVLGGSAKLTSSRQIRAPRAKPKQSWPYPPPTINGLTVLGPNKMNIFKRIAYIFLNKDEYDVLRRYNNNKNEECVPVEQGDSDENIAGEDSFRFDVIPAAGGTIIQTRHYDKRQDLHVRKLHIITSDEDMPTALSHIFALEQLGR